MNDQMTTADECEQLARGKLISESARIPWQDLQRFFANGTAIFVAPELDMVEAAYQISIDNAVLVQKWQAGGLLGQVADSQAMGWLESGVDVWSVVVRPWVLVQPADQHP